MIYFDLKKGVNINDLQHICPALHILLTRTILYSQEYKLPCVITSLIGDRDNIKTSSKTHAEGRAFDISVNGWTDQHVHRFCFIICRDYEDIGAISSEDMKPRAAIYHDSGYGAHIHLQVRPDAKVSKFIKE
jgi:hypothetical protein